MNEYMKEMFTIGFSGNQEELKKLLNTSTKIKTVYTGGLKNMIQGGRPQYCSSMEEIEGLVNLADQYGTDFEIALNAPCGLEDYSNKGWWREVEQYLKELESIGVKGIVASHPFIMETVKSCTNLRVIASTICEINTVRSALYYEQIGADIIIPSMNVNYDIQLLKDMKHNLKKAKIRLMVNEHCLGDCPWRRFHHSHYAHSQYEADYHMHCRRVYLGSPYLLLTNSVIRPEDLCNYTDFIDDFKIVGRQVPMDILCKVVSVYDKKSYKGNYIELFDHKLAPHLYIENSELKDLFINKSRCKKICHTCNRCYEMFQKAKQN